MTERVERLLNRIPGYTGYRTKESMRDDDRRLRQETARTLSQCIAELTTISSQLASDRRFDQISRVEDTIGRVRKLESRVRTATYGYGGLFSDRSIDEYALQQLKQFDVAFQAEVDDLAARIASAGAAGSLDSTSGEAIDKGIADLDRLFDSRGDVIETARPTNDPDILKLLEKPRELSPQQRQLLSLRRGGTGAILGDNVQFTSHIALASPAGDPVLTLVELDHGPDWLAVSDNGTTVDAWRVAAASGAAMAMHGAPAKASISGPGGESSGVMASYSVTAEGSGAANAVSIVVDLGGSVQAFSGTGVPLIDLQVFSESGSLT